MVSLEKPIYRLFEHGDLIRRDARDGELTLTVAGWGDYFGNEYDRSNYRVLLESFPDEIGGYGNRHRGHTLYLLTANLTDEAVDEIIAASKYNDGDPALDDGDLWELEVEMQNESWERGVYRDVKSDLESALDIEDFDETFPGIDSDELRNLFEQVYAEENGGCYGHAEGATTWIWPSSEYDEALPALADAVLALMIPEPAPNQEALPV